MKYITSKIRLWAAVCGLMSLPFCGIGVLIFFRAHNIISRSSVGPFALLALMGLSVLCVIAAVSVTLGYASSLPVPHDE